MEKLIMETYAQTNSAVPVRFVPTSEEAQARSLVYEYLDKMIQLKDTKFAHFSGPEGERSWLELIDDSKKIINGSTLSREAQGKEAWQSNMMDNISRPKPRPIAAGAGLKVPGMKFTAT